MLQIVTDGMKLCPDNPNFIRARDAIFQADYVDYRAVDQGYLAQAFSKRGMGYGAVAGDSSTTTNVAESFVVLPISAPCQPEQ